MFIRTVLSSVAAFLLFSTSALAVQPLEIKAVVVDDSADPIRLYIQGENFLNGNELELTLGEDIKLILDKDSLTNTSVTATLPPGNYEGSYQLTATTGGGSVRFDEFDGVTIGAVGPQGPEGVKGDKGDKGDTGASGVDGQDGANCYDGIGTSVADCIGPQGEKGDKGDKGDTGATGDQGVAGADGADGKDGADGAQGPPGAPGLISLITTDSLVGTACDVFGNGGTRVRSGLDADRDGVLVDAEVQAVEYVCNGADGPKGAQGPQGEQGPHGSKARLEWDLISIL